MLAREVVSLLVHFVMLVIFLMVCDVVCMIVIHNLVSLSQSVMLRVFVGRDIDLWVIGRVWLVFFGLFDECILRAFFLAFNVW